MRPDQYRGQLFRSDRARPRWPHPDRASGRHALDEDALFTPIFHEMTRDDLPVIRDPEPEPEVDRFERDPLTAPIPIPVLRSAWLPELADEPADAHAVPRPQPSPEQYPFPDRHPRRSLVHHAPVPPSGYRWDGHEWHPVPAPWETHPGPSRETDPGAHRQTDPAVRWEADPAVRWEADPAVLWEADPAVHALTSTGRHHIVA